MQKLRPWRPLSESLPHEISWPRSDFVDHWLVPSGHHNIRDRHSSGRRTPCQRAAGDVLEIARSRVSALLQSLAQVNSVHGLASVSISVAYGFACVGWGLIVAWVWDRRSRAFNAGQTVDFSVKLASCFLTGVAACSALLTVLGLVGQLRPIPVTVALLPGIFGLVLGRRHWRACLDAGLCAVAAWKAMPAWLSVITGFTVLLAFALGIGAWILPPKGDAAAFYLVYPKVIAATGLLEPIPGPFYFFSAIGLPVELHYAALIALSDDRAAKLLMFPIAISAGVFLAGIVRSCGGSIVAVTVSWAMLLSSYTFHHYIFDGKVDLAAAAFGLASVYWLLLGTKSKSVAAYVAAGWFAGLASVAKFSYLLALGVSLSTLLAWQLASGRSRGAKFATVVADIARVGVVMALVALVAWIPQLIKNQVLFDAPLAPFIGVQGDDGNWLNQAWFSQEDTRKILLTYPLALVFGRYPGQGGGLSFLYLAFLPFLVWLPPPLSWRKSVTTAVSLAALAALVAWLVLRPSVIAPRYILASLLMFVPLLALAVEAVLTHPASQPVLRMATTAVIVLALSASFWHLLPIPGALSTRISSPDKACVLASPECDPFRRLADVARSGDRILVASYYPYWLTPPQLQCRDTLEEQREMPGESDLLPWLKMRGFAYAIVDPAVAPKLAAGLRQLAASNAGDVEELNEGLALKLYRIRNDLSNRMRCMESTPGRWRLQEESR